MTSKKKNKNLKNKKSVNPKMVNKKLENLEIKKETKVSEKINPEIKKGIIIGIIVLIIVGLFYLLTYFGVEKGAFGKKYTPAGVPDAVITYDQAFIGIVFNRPDTEYYVAFDNFGSKEANLYFNSILSSYSSKEEKLPIYKVDMSETNNKKYLSEISNKEANNDTELKIKTPTLIKIKNKMNVLYLDDINQIKEELN